MPAPALETAVFTAAGATVDRRLDEYAAADIVNVKNFDAKGDGSTNDRPAIQAAIDYALGSASAPNGATNAHLNKPLFFPHGRYMLTDGPIIFTAVKNGHIFGSVNSLLTRPFNSTSTQVVKINGMEDTLMENLSIQLSGTSTGSVCLDIDWDGVTTFGVGLGHNTFRKMEIGGSGSTDGATGVRIANAGNGGAGNYFWNVISTVIGTSYHIVGANATGQVFQGICGGAECGKCWLVDGGSIGAITGVSNAGTNVQTDIVINNASTVTVQGIRSEASWFLELNAAGAKAIVQAVTVGSGGHTGTQENIKLAPGTTLMMDGVVTYAVVATSPGTTPKPIIYKRGGSKSDGTAITFSPSSSDFTFLQDI